MIINDWVHIIAGTVVMSSIALAHWVHPNWIYLTIFAGANLFQSGITKFCPPEYIMKKMGMKQTRD